MQQYDTVKPVCNDHLCDKIYVIYSVMCFNGDWRYQFTVANNFCLMELIYAALCHLDELQKAEKYPLGGRYRQLSLYV